ncbi:T9SS type B sorting domain-containing protein [Psychroserpens ponticola]|uniref:Choice-of-anchor L domain-containing protein n=1 Tax=Psychroserpens ponticola TaxID=2932268 RepID=A0ABY7RVS0_9FLAO|nr:choice-of-anchor L domain-containing protein [Psychroserpens ponticola]WCO00346.1 choice-of-anchor L domain-containing protein [Psychroserpens ponticola]
MNTTLAQQISTDSSQTLEALIQANLGQGCVEISNISSSVNGQFDSLDSFGSFNKANSNFPFENGIILSTGSISSAGNSFNPNNLNEGSNNWPTDPDLETNLGVTNTLNATSIEFDFVSAGNLIAFNYILASEEYNTSFPCQYSDGFAFLIKKSDTPDPFENIALVPGTSIPVNTNTIHDEVVGFCDGQNAQYFEGYNVGDTNYNGRTKVLTARVNDISPNVSYRIKLIIADQTDRNYDSAVFIEGTSTLATVDLGEDIDTCGQSVLLNGDVQNSLASYQWFENNLPIAGANDSTFQATNSGTYRVEIDLQINSSSCIIEDEINIVLDNEQNVDAITNFIRCDDASNDGHEIFDLATKDNEVINAVSSGNYDISYHLTNAGALTETATITGPYQNITNPQTIYVRIEDIDTECLAYSTFDLVVNNAPIYIEPSDLEICDDGVSDGITTINLDTKTDEITAGNTNLLISYHSTQEEADLNQNEILSPYTNTNAFETLFIRIEDATSGCVNTTEMNIQVLENPIINQEVQWINACETDGDGFEFFNLTSVVDEILLGLTGVSYSFYETLIDAQEGINVIPNTTAYQNTTPFFQLVYITVTNDVTGCSSIMSIELHTNIVESGFNTNDFGVCDDASNDEIADFNLNDVRTAILASYVGFDISFFENENDQLNNSNALDQDVPYTATSISTIIYITATIDSCDQFNSIELVIHPAIKIQPLESVEYCDTDFDGSTSIFLPSFNDYVSFGIDFPSVKYYITEQNAIDNENVLPQNYTNTVNPITLYTRVANTQTTCYDISSLEILVIDPPIVMQPSDIIICDDDQDGYSIVDLENRIPEIVSDTTDLLFTFHTTFEDADFGTNSISTPESYNTQTETVFVRIESLITTCHIIVNFDVIINTLPVFIPISNFITCESDDDGINDFVFNLKDDEILNGQLGKQVLYFETAQDAINRSNIIDKNITYQNASNPQTIHVRVENLTDIDCFGTSSLILNVTPFPLFNQPVSYDVCDDISNDGFENFDLTQKVTEVSNNIPESLDISFHQSYSDANLDLNELPLNYTNITNPQLLYVRIENGSFCHSLSTFLLNVVQVPEINSAPDLISCDNDFDGIVSFDLTQIESNVLDVRIDDINISYHETLENAENSSGTILDPDNYTNTSNPQTVYIKVTNTLSNCYSIQPINLSVNLPPLINAFQEYQICYNSTSSFDLNDINFIIVNDDTDVVFSYYQSLSDAQNSANALDTNYTYSTSNDTIFSRIEYATTGCFYIYPFELIINPLPIANQPPGLQACDDISNDEIENFNLFSVNNAVLGSQDSNDFTVTYFNTQAEADIGNSPVTYNYTGQDGEIIFARIENNSTGCYNLTQFNLIVNIHPKEPSQITNCDTDYDGFTPFDLTQAESELFDIVNPDNIISYFESIDDLQNDINSIGNPSNYINITSPQTIYIKIFNTIANCYTHVPLELDVNLPPAIDPLDEFELCDNGDDTVTLSDINSKLLTQSANAFIVYYSTEFDAINQTNPLDDNYEYQSTNDTVFARVEFSTTHCFHIHEFNLIVNLLPIANTPNNLEACDDDYDGLYFFDLSSQNFTVLNGQNPNDFTVSYYGNLLSAEDNIDALNTIYVAINNETIYVRVENNTTGCYDITSFQIIIHPKPIANIGSQVICLENLPLTISANTNQIGDTYLWSTNQTSPEIEIVDIGTYSVTITSPFGCETTEVFTVTESEAATITVTESIDFSDPNNVIVTVDGIGNYMYQLGDDEPQLSNVFENVSLGYHTLTIIDLNGCASITKDIVVIDAPKFMTPNEDGRFDTWHITGVETLPGTIIYIFDRYGKLIKTLTSNSPGWNGTYNGSVMPNSDYWYIAKVKDGEKSFEVKGHFSLRL